MESLGNLAVLSFSKMPNYDKLHLLKAFFRVRKNPSQMIDLNFSTLEIYARSNNIPFVKWFH